MKFVHGIRLKDELTIDEITGLGRISEAIADPPSGRFRRWRFVTTGINDIIRLTTTKRFVFFWHRKHINEIIDAHDMQKKIDKVQKKLPFLESIRNTVTFLAVELKQTSRSIARETPVDHVSHIYIQIMKKKIEDWTMMAIAQHNPKEIKKITDRLRQQTKMIKAKEESRKSNNTPGIEGKRRNPVNVMKYAAMS